MEDPQLQMTPHLATCTKARRKSFLPWTFQHLQDLPGQWVHSHGSHLTAAGNFPCLTVFQQAQGLALTHLKVIVQSYLA